MLLSSVDRSVLIILKMQSGTSGDKEFIPKPKLVVKLRGNYKYNFKKAKIILFRTITFTLIYLMQKE